MSDDRVAPASRQNKDRWGLNPARPGVLRGIIGNVRLSTEEGKFGLITVFDFDLNMGKDQPQVPVRMAGNDFTGRVIHGTLADVADPEPAQRPIQATRMVYPQGDGQMIEILAHFPGRGGRPKARDNSFAVLMIVFPLVLAVSFGLLIFWYFHK